MEHSCAMSVALCKTAVHL